MAAAYALLEAGYIQDFSQPGSLLSVGTVRDRYGKNGAYAVIAANLLLSSSALRGDALWQQVRESFRRETREEPAVSQQGAVTVAEALFLDGELRRPLSGAA